MVAAYFPFASGPGSTSGEDRWAKMAKLWAPNGLVPDSTLPSLGAGLNWTIPVGMAGWVNGFYHENITSTASVTGPTNTNSQPRLHRLVMKLDLSAKTLLPVVKEGAPSGTPVLPSLAAGEYGLAHATCPGSASPQNYSALVIEAGSNAEAKFYLDTPLPNVGDPEVQWGTVTAWAPVPNSVYRTKMRMRFTASNPGSGWIARIRQGSLGGADLDGWVGDAPYGPGGPFWAGSDHWFVTGPTPSPVTFVGTFERFDGAGIATVVRGASLEVIRVGSIFEVTKI